MDNSEILQRTIGVLTVGLTTKAGEEGFAEQIDGLLTGLPCTRETVPTVMACLAASFTHLAHAHDRGDPRSALEIHRDLALLLSRGAKE
ncbi:hypothetical protein [Streptomyces tsukubensis]|uniref:Uncharacterized protein n=1 Tax=Streptomyces tsukubensis TaxID=83656 RepID=A0A1V4A9S7_9ACTN|nr:hypothetical protein [Streptomyces tsukubensis]OON80054.1 hypothetical protein B1H18_12815 [Streptomyces tsukubensis]QFR97287.1 hypothetical protein GBW32_34780 [Streptomyces tsukubensis]